jgi:hypothetical protein
MGGLNHYRGQARFKPVLAGDHPNADHDGVKRILALSRRMESAWLAMALPAMALPMQWLWAGLGPGAGQ